jgi:hypothetical protein
VAHYNPNSQCVDTASDMDSWFDFSNLASPTPGSTQTRMSSSQATSALTSPTSHLLPLEAIEEHAVLQPSHEYSRFKQQTGLPTSIQHLHQLSSAGQPFPNYDSGIDGLGGFNSMAGDMRLDVDSKDSDMQAFFFPGDSQNSDFIDPTDVLKQEEAQANIRFYPGMHQQQAALAQQQKQQQMMLQKQKQQEAEQHQRQARRSVSSQSSIDQRTEETIARVVNQIRQSSSMSADAMSPGGSSMLPHIIRNRKDEDDMDEDERLLNSEEGKKLSSKERRQLRNKVSARAFRSRRKGKHLHL